MPRLLTTGPRPKSPPGPVPPRLDVATFVKPENIKQFSLYIQALDELYKRGTNIIDSYYQLGGIHGKPYVMWNDGPGWETGYCVHGKSTFSTWHRAYMSVFEQIIHEVARKIAESYTVEPDLWKEAAQLLRQPYWNWDTEAYAPLPPEVAYLKQVEIILAPGDKKTLVPNPFWEYKFRPGETDTFSDYLKTWQATAKAPNDDGTTNLEKLKESIEIRAREIEKRMALLYSMTDWSEFIQQLTLNPHNTMHNAVAGVGVVNRAGHMGFVEVAGFDPTFWLHHAQVDRVIEIWHRKHGKWETSNDDLTPFWKTEDAFWKSPDNDIIKPDVYLNYDYDKAIVPPLPRVPNGHLHDWHVRIRCKQFELGGSFAIFVFLGEVPADRTKWLKHEKLVGIFDVFANAKPDECANCTKHRDLVLDSFLFLNKIILESAGLPSLEPGIVVPYLKGKLHWGIHTADGRVPPISELPSLEVTVYQVTLTDSGGVVNVGEPDYYHEITRGQPGGHKIV